MSQRLALSDAILIGLVFLAAFSVPIVDAVIHSALRWLGITVVFVAAVAVIFLVLREPSGEPN